MAFNLKDIRSNYNAYLSKHGHRGRVYGNIDYCVSWIFALTMFAAVAFLLIFLAAGVWELCLAANIFEWPWAHKVIGNADPLNMTIQKIVHALELFILAPLPYVVLEGLAIYLAERVAPNPEARAKAAAGFSRVKALVAGILVSIVTVNIVGKVLYEEELRWDAVAPHLLIIFVLAGYFVVMEKLAREGEERRGQPAVPEEP